MRHASRLSMGVFCTAMLSWSASARAQHTGHTTGTMGLADPLGVPAMRAGSGTSWLPDASPMDALHYPLGDWSLMLHASVFAQMDAQGGPRGATQFAAPNWVMGELGRPAAGGVFRLRAMLSADAWTVGDGGYPLLLQTGEAYHGAPLYDRQHPHDLFTELAAIYAHPIASGLAASIYLAPAGEPAVGPAAFPHRPSAAFDPAAPLSHHWQDATHITFGVATLGVFSHDVRLEASVFNGREPDEIRTNIDFALNRMDSWGMRASMNPSAEWSLSAWYGYLKDVEPTQPGESLRRFGASAIWARDLGASRTWTGALVYGANAVVGSGEVRHSVLLESTIDLDRSNAVFGRAEYVRKGADDLGVLTVASGVAFDVGALALGYAHTIRVSDVALSLGTRAAMDLVPEALRSLYGSRTPVGAIIYLRVRLGGPRAAGDMAGMRM